MADNYAKQKASEEILTNSSLIPAYTSLQTWSQLHLMNKMYQQANGATIGIQPEMQGVWADSTKYMTSALNALKGENELSKKFGRDLDATNAVAALMKQRASELKFQRLMDPFVQADVDAAPAAGGDIGVDE